MHKILRLVAGLSLLMMLFTGCKTVADTVKPAAKPVGGVAAVPQSITQGINEGYVEQTSSTVSNPYGR